MTLNEKARARYARQIVLPDFGEGAQERLAEASVLVVGAGGLGSPALLYLAAAGVGRIAFIDDDVVDRSNLHRQILYSEADIDTPKVDAASERLRALNSEITIEPHRERLTSENALDFVRSVDVVLEGTDRFETRYLVNDASILTGTPAVFGSVFRFEGQVAAFGLDGGPCYRCLFPEPPPPGAVPDCAEGGVIGAIPGVIGSLQALEAITLLAGLRRDDDHRLLRIDGLTLKTNRIRISRDPSCPLCGDAPTITSLVDYEAFCGTDAAVVPEITASELASLLQSDAPPTILDVRTPTERESASIGGVFVPISELAERLDEIPWRDVVVVCRSGRRSEAAARLLLDAGRSGVRNLTGGLDAWRRDVDPSLPPA